MSTYLLLLTHVQQQHLGKHANVISWYIVFGFTTMNLLGCLLIQFLGCLPFEDNFSITSGE